MSERNLLLLSTSTVYGSSLLDYCIEAVQEHFKGVDEIIFVPYARPGGISNESYTKLIRDRLAKIRIKVIGMNELKDAERELGNFEGIYIGGGNTFLLLDVLYRENLMDLIRTSVLSGGMRYMGSSAGSNVACQTINTTNDMPIVYPPAFDALKLVPFNINPHFTEPAPNSRHMGESNEARIREFLFQRDLYVVALREGSWLKIEGNQIDLRGELPARIFLQRSEPMDVKPGEDISFLMDSRNN